MSLGQTYLEICIDAVPNPRIAVGEVRAKNKMLTGMRFYVLGSFAGTPSSPTRKSGSRNMGVLFTEKTQQRLSYIHTPKPRIVT